MVDSPSDDVTVKEKKRLTDQFFVNPDIETSGFPVQPYTSFYKTNNFIQQTFSRLLGYYPTDRRWFPLYTDDSGRLLVSPEVTDGASVFIRNREAKDVTIFTDRSIANLTAVTHAGVDFSGYASKSIMIKSNGNVTVYPQGSNDNTNWYDLVDSTGSAISLVVNNVTKSIEWTEPTHYFRCVLVNTSGVAVTVTMLYHGRV